jgi:2-octaprenyl-6-methoxyphenol hydroxylase
VIENAWLGRVLLTQVRQQPLIELIDGVQVTSLTQDADQVQIEAMRNGEYIHSLKSKLVIAADGRDSFCRQAIGVGVDEHDYDQVAIVTTVQTSKPHQHVGFERFSALGPLALLPLPGEYRRSVVWPVKKALKQNGWVKKMINISLMLYRKPMVIVLENLKKQVNVLAIHWLRFWHISRR